MVAEGEENHGSSSNLEQEETTANSPEEQQNKRESRKDKEQDQSTLTVPLYKLFAFADSTDYILMLLGSLGAAGNGISLPLMTVLFGNLIQSFGGTSNGHDALHQVSKVCTLRSPY